MGKHVLRESGAGTMWTPVRRDFVQGRARAETVLKFLWCLAAGALLWALVTLALSRV